MRTFFILIVSTVVTGAAGAAWVSVEVHAQAVPRTVKVQFGDDARWARPGWNDADWMSHPLYPLPDTQAVFWVRTDVWIHEAEQPFEAMGLYFSALAAWEVYWDGVLIGRNGRVGTGAESERPGSIDALILIPDSLYERGPHTLALRLSNFHRPESIYGYVYGLVIDEYEDLITTRFRAALLPLLFLGGFLLIAAYYGVLYLLDRKRPALLIFSLLCFSVSALLVFESWRFTLGYDYDVHLVRLRLVSAFTAGVGILLPAFFAVEFRVRYARAAIVAVAVLLGLSLMAPGYDGKSFFMFWSMFAVSAVITGWAAIRQKKGAVLASVGVAVCIGTLALTRFLFLDTFFFPAFSVLILCLLTSLGLRMRAARKRHEEALLSAARLEIELLKKHLQPHFLLNTLTSAMAWLEEHPRTGVRFIEALAEELEMLGRISDKSLIPMKDELLLCRTHLELMGYRRDVRFHLDTESVDEDAMVPPALFHTLIENGITHNTYTSDEVRFWLREERQGGRRRYVVITPQEEPSQFITPQEEPSGSSAGERTGLRYVRARLEEAYSDRWTLSSHAVEGGWQTVIEIPA